VNPGNLRSDLWRHQFSPFQLFVKTFVLHDPINGAYTELFAGLSEEVTLEKTGSWIAPWGRFADMRSDLLEASKTKEDGGNGNAKDFWEWSEEQVKAFV
jgi:retinol dehydrogenase-12